MRNKLVNITQEEASTIKNKAETNHSVFLVELQGRQIQTWEAYAKAAEDKFKFPTPCLDSVDRYMDWMTDLSWLNRDSFVVIIYDVEVFLSKDDRAKKIVLESFAKDILPWWQGEVEQFVVEGKPKSFDIYLVD